MSNADWTSRSLAHVWQPCTQMKDHEWLPLTPIASAEGVWLTDMDGKRYLDAVSSWWTNIFGHRHPRVVEALKQQLDTLDHVMFAGFTHAPAVELAERLVALTPEPLQRCFFADNGSAAVEVALKMSFHYWRNTGHEGKTRFVALDNGYHGETLGALGVGGTGLYRDAYKPLMLEPIHVPSPDCFHRAPGSSWEDHSRAQFRHMESVLAEHGDTICAVILEPLVQCAGGMRMYHPIYLKLLREACDRYGVHLIADEIAVGFGRTGRMFACEWADIAPDFLCLSKGITAGTLPLACVLTGDEVYQAFYDDYSKGKAFLHSHSYTGNPLACRAALATLDVFEEQDWHARNRLLGHALWSALSDLHRHPNVAEIRQQGMILAIELLADVPSRTPYPATERRGLRAYRYALEQGVLLRPLGDVIYLMPPYVLTPEEAAQLAQTAIRAIEHATGNPVPDDER